MDGTRLKPTKALLYVTVSLNLMLGIVYIVARSAGLIFGGRLGAKIARAPPVVQKHIGWCLLPQAGVALGLALLAAEKIPKIGERLLPLIIATTVIFEIVGPVFTQHHLRRAGEVEHSLPVKQQ